jgi:transcriptional regulator with PAS, ATPase and Fis domain
VGGTVDDSGDTRPSRQARAIPYLALGLECDRPTAGAARYSLDDVACITLGRGEERAVRRSEERGVTVLDVRVPSKSMSGSHARIVSAGGEWVVEDADSTNGTFVNGERITRAVVNEGDVVTVGRTLFFVAPSRLTTVGGGGDADTSTLTSAEGLATLEPELGAELEALARIARTSISVLVRGETGTGKELLARGTHELSGRPGAFVAVNCGAIPAGLVEAALFGHVRGAFSGAVRDELGFFRAADGGTLFLDEIGDLPAPSQAALLRALQEREIVPVGSARPASVDLRVVAATHQPIEAMAERGGFRRDLLARLAGFTVELPPLRSRRLDLGLLVASLLTRLEGSRAPSVTFTPAAALALFRHEWPLNTRELEQCLARALALAGLETIDVHHLPTAVAAGQRPPPQRPAEDVPRYGARDAQLRMALLEELARHRGNLADVARAMGKARMQVHRWCKRFGIDPNLYRS